MAQAISTGTFGVAKWVVSPDPTQGTHTTILSALASASSGDTIFVRDGTYTETWTGSDTKAGVTISALSSDQDTGNVTINLTATFTAAGIFTIANCELVTNGSPIMTVSGTSDSVLYLDKCYLNCTNSNAISYTSTGTGSGINVYDCQGNLNTTGIAYHTAIGGAGFIYYRNCTFQNTGLSTTPNSNDTCRVFVYHCGFNSVFSASSVGNVNFYYCDLGNVVATTLSITGTGASNVYFCNMSSGTASAISIGAGNTVNITESNVSSTNANAITGTGTLRIFGGLTFGGASNKVNVTTVIGGAASGLTQGSNPAAGFIGEQIRGTTSSGSQVPVSNLTATNVASTSTQLTPGVWDVSCVGVVGSGITTGVSAEFSISTVSATRGTPGDNAIQVPCISTAANDVGASIPSYRVTLSANTTVYLVAFLSYSVGTGACYGRISATRVG